MPADVEMYAFEISLLQFGVKKEKEKASMSVGVDAEFAAFTAGIHRKDST